MGRFITIIEVIHKIVQYITIRDLLPKISYVELFMMMTIYVFIGWQPSDEGSGHHWEGAKWLA